MNRAERWVSRVLLAGGLLGVLLMTVGVIGAALGTEGGIARLVVDRGPGGAVGGHAADTHVSLHQIARALAHRPLDPLAIATLGIVVLFVTPLASVVTAGAAFALDGDRRFVAVSAVVVASLVLSLWLGGA
jgi:uncharacterized membrane protein